jgi:hypothetical protein
MITFVHLLLAIVNFCSILCSPMVTMKTSKGKGKTRRGSHITVPKAAIRLYSDDEIRVVEIAAKFGVSSAAISTRVKELGLQQRGRGRWKQSLPGRQHRKMLNLLGTETQASVGRQFGLSRQRVNQIARRWASEISQSEREVSLASQPPVSRVQHQKFPETRPVVISFRLSTKLNSSLASARKSLGLGLRTSRNQVARAIVDRFLTAQSQNFQPTSVVKA